jgi:Mor family transcriptional regulator
VTLPREDTPEGNELIAAIVEAATGAARAEGLDPPAARRVATAITDRLRREMGGSRVYIPAPSREARDQAILAGLANGDNRRTVANRVGVSVGTVDRVARRRGRSQEPDDFAPKDWLL